MPLLDSFKVDHTKMKAPLVRIAKVMNTPKGDIITIFDLRFCTPNTDKMPFNGLHTLEHLFAGFMREHLNSEMVEIIDISPMGCATGFYMSVIGKPTKAKVINSWIKSMQNILEVKSQNEIPELNIYQCGSYELHSLDEAKDIAKMILKQNISVLENHTITLSEEQLINIEGNECQ